MTRSVLFIGGTGVLSSACTRAAVEAGMDVTVLTRGSARRTPHPDARVITADIRSPEVATALAGREFDAVADFVAFTPEHVRTDLGLFGGRCGQYVLLSSATVYRRPPVALPVHESAEQSNEHWAYARDKIASERALIEEAPGHRLPFTIVRPSHTYDGTRPVTLGGWTDIARLRAGEPIFLHDGGGSIWTITHAEDFARGFTALLGEPRAVGRAFTLTGDEALPWSEIVRLVATAAGVDAPRIVPVDSAAILERDAEFGSQVLGDRGWSMTFDTTAMREILPGFGVTIPFSDGVHRLIEHFDALPPEQRRDPAMDARIERVLAG